MQRLMHRLERQLWQLRLALFEPIEPGVRTLDTRREFVGERQQPHGPLDRADAQLHDARGRWRFISL